MQKEINPSLSPIKKPDWLKIRMQHTDEFRQIKQNIKEKKLFTVCTEASCPNIHECWAAKTATIMILGDTCTRACKFCHVKSGNPKGLIDRQEIENAVEMVGIMNLAYVVITSVDRDDLPDQGSGHFAAVIEKIRATHTTTKIEVLIPDFSAEPAHMHRLAQSRPFVIGQNIETVEHLTHEVRDRRAGYKKTLDCLAFYKTHYPQIATKSSLMVGLGEGQEEIFATLKDLRRVNVDIVTLGQYLRPSMRHLPVVKYYTPQEFEEMKEKAYSLGFSFVASGPLVRSSYKAAEYLKFIEARSTLSV
ncbi:MAG: lipoyl synthase [Bdellovibrio sp.]|nr:lipoyl synthase [Bdellovibrio sp.]